MAEVLPYIISGALTIGGGGLFFYGFNRMKRFQLMSDTPTSKIRSMAMGIVEVTGKATAKTYLKAPFSQDSCVYYKYQIQEYRRHVTTDSKGNVRTTYSWDTLASGKRHIPFLTTDDTGSVLVNPDKSEFNVKPHKAFYQKAGLFGGFGRFVKALKAGKTTDVSNLTPIDPKKRFFGIARVGDRRYYEYLISPDEQVYILGTAANVARKVVIKKGSNNKTYIISDRSEKELSKKLKINMTLSFIFGGLLFLGGIVLGYMSITGAL